MDFLGIGLFFLQWWGICLICMGFVLTVLIGCYMIVGLTKKVWRQFFPKRGYTPDFSKD